MTDPLPFAWRLRAALAIVLVPPVLRLTSFARLASWLGRPSRTTAQPVDDASLSAWVDARMLRLPPPWRRTCLTRGAVMFGLLRRAGRPVTLRLGVRRRGSALSAHAWLVRDEAPYLEPRDEVPADYQTIAEFPEPAPHP